MIKRTLKNALPKSVKQSFIGDIYRFVRSVRRGPSQNPTPSSVSSSHESVSESTYTSEPEPQEFDVDIRASQLLEWRDNDRTFIILDIREPHELQYGFCTGSWIVPMNNIPQEQSYLPTTTDIVIACAAGVRSWSVAQYLRQQGFEKVWSLENGVPTWSEQGWESPKRGLFSVGHQVMVAGESDSDDGVQSHGYVANIQSVDGVLQYSVQRWDDQGGVVVTSHSEAELSNFVS